MAKHHNYTVEQIAWLKSRRTLSRRAITLAFNSTFGASISEGAIKGTMQRNGIKTGRTGQFEKGESSWNRGKVGVNGVSATCFQKGRLPHNHNPLGHVRYCDKNGYMSVKMTDTRTTRKDYVAVHRLVWEHYHGPIPPSHIISFIDGDIYNFKIENLEMLSRALHATRCKLKYHSYPIELRPQLDVMIDLHRSLAKRSKRESA